MGTLDLSRFLAVAEATDGDVAGLALFYLEYMHQQLEALRTAIAAGRAADVELIAHRCAGSNGIYGMDALVVPFAALETRARTGELSAAAVLESEVRRQFAAVEAALRERLAGRDDGEHAW